MSIDPRRSVAEIVKDHPAAGPVLARFGLDTCCGGKHPLEMACRAHRVDLAEVLRALDEVTMSASVPVASSANLARENLYRRFLKTSLLFTLTGGTALGAWALAMMALRERLGGVDRGVIQVHGHWQLFGWVGLFVVGVAYHILPRLTGVPLPSLRAAAWSHGMLASGIVLRFSQSLDPGLARDLLLPLSAALEIAGVSLFAWTLWRILGATPRPRPAWQRCCAHGTGWLLAASFLNAAHAVDLVRSGRFEIAPWLNVPYLTVFLVGFVTFWIFGVSLRTLPVFMGLADRPRLAARIVLPLSAAVGLLAVAEGLFLKTGGDAARISFGVGSAAVGTILALFVFALGVLAPVATPPEPGADRGDGKFVRLAYAWLLLSGGMLLAFSWATLAGTQLDHAYVGAYRHALTVGFITTLMAGMAMRIVPIFRGVPLYSTRMRDWTFWLLAVGNVIRVLFQALSAAAGPAWLRVAGVSGILELAALVLFAVNLWKTMDTANADDRAAAGRKPEIAPEARVGALLEAR
jgi:uncharacterized protein involved in response to NO